MEKQKYTPLVKSDLTDGDAHLDTSGYYTLKINCINCGFSDKIWISKGIWGKDVSCPTCHCESLIKD